MKGKTIFISLAKWRKKPTRDEIRESDTYFDSFRAEGGKILSVYWTIGRYDAVLTIEAPNERTAMKALIRWGDLLDTETMIAVPREEALRMVE